ncbi:menaquinol-cytochrome c reductase cytochrome b/c subunit [Cytobacillus purgationiresistens]|uniref:Menaquinol:cytochrome c reductase cytochrome c subunit n=1 Tax=Cytobacillus purgationiresistens TaxID=863449 RepID=A0ABU0AII2_9BACI|nr:menaquinol-cytochrome c reductase cytochrome b/c subunit [Cytobacillus purgationiresistens]MDQ0271066.1 menaquinol-cytochrome c reductase cytochrome b/c subunit [Cytobacillus purgationiresistens]
MHRGKGMKFVGDSRVSAEQKTFIPKDYSEYPGKTEAFWPNFLLKEWMVGAVFLIGFLCLTIAHEPPLEKIADPSDTAYIPLPDWYFLFLYQLLKYTYASGPYNAIGAFIIPGLVFGALLLAPFLDRGPERKPSKRPFATGFMLLAIAGVTFLTWESVAHHDWEAAAQQGKIVADAEIDTEAEGYKLMEANTCLTCHGNELQGGAGAPALVEVDLSPEEIHDVIVNGRGAMPAGIFTGTDEELNKVVEFISSIESE